MKLTKEEATRQILESIGQLPKEAQAKPEVAGLLDVLARKQLGGKVGGLGGTVAKQGENNRRPSTGGRPSGSNQMAGKPAGERLGNDFV